MGAVNTTNTFTATDVITSTKMNNIIDQTVMTSDAITGSTLQVVAPGKLQVAAGGITSTQLANDAVTTLAITDANVTPAKLANADFGDFTVASGVATLDNDVVTTVKILNDNVTTAKIADDAITTLKILNSNVTPAKLSQPLTLATAQNSTSGTSIDFTSIPSWVKKISVLFSSVSTNGFYNLLIQIGDSGGIENTGYKSIASDYIGSTSEETTGFVLNKVNTSDTLFKGSIVLNLISGNTFVSNGTLAQNDPANNTLVASSAGTKTLSNTLDRLRITTVSGIDTFDAGVINIIYE